MNEETGSHHQWHLNGWSRWHGDEFSLDLGTYFCKLLVRFTDGAKASGWEFFHQCLVGLTHPMVCADKAVDF